MVPPPVLPHHVAYTLRTGPYKNAGSAFQDLCKLIPPSTRAFGIYYDDTYKVSHLHGTRDASLGNLQQVRDKYKLILPCVRVW